MGKVTSDLASKIEAADDDGLVEVVVELDAPKTKEPVEQRWTR